MTKFVKKQSSIAFIKLAKMCKTPKCWHDLIGELYGTLIIVPHVIINV